MPNPPSLNQTLFAYADSGTGWIKNKRVPDPSNPERLVEIPEITPLDPKTYSTIYSMVGALCKKANIEPMTLYQAEMPIPHVVELSPTAMVFSDKLLTFPQEEAAMYAAHKLGHGRHGIAHIISKLMPRTLGVSGVLEITAAVLTDPIVRDYTAIRYALSDKTQAPPAPNLPRRTIIKRGVAAAGLASIASVYPVWTHNNAARETQADDEAVALLNNPKLLSNLLIHLTSWCEENNYFPDITYPGIAARIANAQTLIKAEKTSVPSPG